MLNTLKTSLAVAAIGASACVQQPIVHGEEGEVHDMVSTALKLGYNNGQIAGQIEAKVQVVGAAALNACKLEQPYQQCENERTDEENLRPTGGNLQEAIGHLKQSVEAKIACLEILNTCLDGKLSPQTPAPTVVPPTDGPRFEYQPSLKPQPPTDGMPCFENDIPPCIKKDEPRFEYQD